MMSGIPYQVPQLGIMWDRGMAAGRGLPLLGSRGDTLGVFWGPSRAHPRASDRLLRRPKTYYGALAQCGATPARLLLCLCIAVICGALLLSSGTLPAHTLPSQAVWFAALAWERCACSGCVARRSKKAPVCS